MRTELLTIENWKLVTIPNEKVKKDNFCPTTAEQLVKAGFSPIKATVPGNFELDVMSEKDAADIYFGTNVLKAMELENLHLYYSTKFNFYKKEQKDAFIVFNGIDTVAEIFIDGKFFAFVENMLHEHVFSLNDLADGTHDLFIHILPTAIYARQFEVPAMCYGLPYNHDSINIRKAPYMFGWDIMPRIVSGGIYKSVEIKYLPKTRIENAFTATSYVNTTKNVAGVWTYFDVITDHDFMTDFTATVSGKCKDSTFTRTIKLFNKHQRVYIEFNNPLLWWPKNYGEQNLYDIEVTLFFKGEQVDKVTYKTGVRTARLRRSSVVSEDGDFCFMVNDKRIFVNGTNWVPTDAFPSRHEQYTLRGIEMVDDLNCNMIRCWGGNVYPTETLYDYCDEHGIMIWQDFALGCGNYYDDQRVCALIKKEVELVAKKYRNHPALVLYAGDNECDVFISTSEKHNPLDTKSWLNPNDNTITRSVILKTLRNHDATRSYIPSSPYIDQTAYLYGNPSEDHLWGPRDYFKGEFYKNPSCYFASEIGYHGCPSPKSLEKFIPKDSLTCWGDTNTCTDKNWLAHSTAMEVDDPSAYYIYRIPLVTKQVDRIFTFVGKDLDTYARQSQISQAEAVKYFIEHFRAKKWQKTGILWWNVIDGWPQISDAVVDWYGVKKLAYHYIKRSQSPFMMMVDEPENGKMNIVAVNDSREIISANYTVKDLCTDKIVASGKVTIEPDQSVAVKEIEELDHAFYLIEWESNIGAGKNHHATSLGDKWEYEKYALCMKKAGFYDEFEGF